MRPFHEDKPIEVALPYASHPQRGVDEARILFAPGKAANAGGVAVSGLEQSQNALRLSWTSDEVDSRLRDIMGSIHDKCVAHGTVDDRGNGDGWVNYVDGANIAGFVKVADSMIAYGVV